MKNKRIFGFFLFLCTLTTPSLILSTDNDDRSDNSHEQTQNNTNEEQKDEVKYSERIDFWEAFERNIKNE